MNLQEFVGQKRLKEELAAIMTHSDGWNIILRGHYGCGKTTLAVALAEMFGLYSYQIGYDDKLPRRATIHIIDEAHLIPQFELLYHRMECFNFIFCTNMGGRLPEPFISRCLTYRLTPYNNRELAEIVGVHAKIRDIGLSGDVCEFIGARSKGIPRTAVTLLRRFLAVCASRRIPPVLRSAEGIFEEFGVDADGLTLLDRKYLTAISASPKSRRTLMAMLDLDPDEFDRLERYLIGKSLVDITSRGRILAR